MKGKKGLSNRVLAALCFTMALVLLLPGLGATLAKYARQDKQNGMITAAPFHFECEDLEQPYHQLSEPAEGTQVEITFTLTNYKNEFTYTIPTIEYTCWVECAGETIERAEAKASGQLAGNECSDVPVTLTLERSDFGEDNTVRVFAQSTAPYVKTVSAEFGFSTQINELQWTVEEQNGAVVLEIYGGSGDPVTVTWPAALTPDPYNEILQGVSGNSVTFAPQPGVRYALTFLNPQGGTYNKEDFTVTKG